MKIKKIKLSEKDKLKAYRTAVRNSIVESGLDKSLRTKVYRNKKKYSRKDINVNKLRNEAQDN
jgi:hypothetical protein